MKRELGLLLCAIGFHKYGKYQLHQFNGRYVYRVCKRCGKVQDRRLF